MEKLPAAMGWPLRLAVTWMCRWAWKIAGVTRPQLAFVLWLATVFFVGVDGVPFLSSDRAIELLVVLFMFWELTSSRLLAARVTGRQDMDGPDVWVRAVEGFLWLQTITNFAANRTPVHLWPVLFWTFQGILDHDDDDERGEPVLHRAVRRAVEAAKSLTVAPSPAGVSARSASRLWRP